MLKLLKYELVKIKTAIYVVLGLVVVLELMNFIGAVMIKFNTFEEFGGDYEEYMKSTQYLIYSLGLNIYMFSIILLVIACFSAAAFVVIFSLISMNNDFCKKQGYNVFLTPNSSTEILGSKYIATFLVFVGYVLICFLMIDLDTRIFCWVYGDDYYNFFKEVIIPLFEETGINFPLMAISIILQYAFYIILAGFTLILSQTLVKTSGVLKILLIFGVYVGVNSLVSTIVSIPTFFIQSNIDEESLDTFFNVILGCTGAGYAIFSVIMFIVSTKLIENKLSL